MNIAEALARQIRRVAGLRYHCEVIGDLLGLALIDASLDRACTAIGSGDPVAIVAAGQELEGVEI
jgi:hypothetical protein